MTARRTRKARAGRGVAADALLALSRVALDAAAQGICVYDADHRIVLFNCRYLELFDMSPDVIRPGITYREVLEHSATRGNFTPDKIEGMLAARLEMIAATAIALDLPLITRDPEIEKITGVECIWS